ncbi:zinc finger CCCH domain-containing protein 19 [Tanacetum coccineum]
MSGIRASKTYGSEGFDDVGRRLSGGVGLVRIALWIKWKASRPSRRLKEIFLEFKGPIIESMEVNSESNPLEWKDAGSGVCGVEKYLVDSLKMSRFVMIRSCIMMGVFRIAWKELGRWCWDVTQVIAPEKDFIIAPQSTPPGGRDRFYQRWSYRDPNGNIHGLFSLRAIRSWKDYFLAFSDLEYYGTLKKAILLHNALSRQQRMPSARCGVPTTCCWIFWTPMAFFSHYYGYENNGKIGFSCPQVKLVFAVAPGAVALDAKAWVFCIHWYLKTYLEDALKRSELEFGVLQFSKGSLEKEKLLRS